MRRTSISVLLGFLLVLSLAGVAAAKGDGQAALDAPIPPGAEPGDELEVGWRAWVPDGETTHPITGSPVFVRLTSPDGAATSEAMGREQPRDSGHYVATIAAPAGGVGLVEVGLLGEACVDGRCSRSDLLFELPADQRAPQPVAATVPAVGAPGTTADWAIPAVIALGVLALLGALVVGAIVRRGARPVAPAGTAAQAARD